MYFLNPLKIHAPFCSKGPNAFFWQWLLGFHKSPCLKRKVKTTYFPNRNLFFFLASVHINKWDEKYNGCLVVLFKQKYSIFRWNHAWTTHILVSFFLSFSIVSVFWNKFTCLKKIWRQDFKKFSGRMQCFYKIGRKVEVRSIL